MEGSCDPIHITYANVFRLGHLPEALTNIIVVSDIDTPFSIPRMPTRPKKNTITTTTHTHPNLPPLNLAPWLLQLLQQLLPLLIHLYLLIFIYLLLLLTSPWLHSFSTGAATWLHACI